VQFDHHAKNFRDFLGTGASELAARPGFGDPRNIIFLLDANYICAKSGPASNKIDVLASSAF
jgi:hypothetical protein